MQHYNIPIFIPHLACPFKCIFCDQRIISAQEKPPTPDAVAEIIAAHLRTINESGIIEVAFFGGSFTALPLTMDSISASCTWFRTKWGRTGYQAVHPSGLHQ